MKKGVLVLVSIVFVLLGSVFPIDNWEVLTSLKFKVLYDEKLDDVIFAPIPTKEIARLDGRTIELKGYLINTELMGGSDVLILSNHPKPYDRCMPTIAAESVVRIAPKQRIEVNSKNYCTLKGRFEFNTTNLLELPYILNEAECLDCGK